MEIKGWKYYNHAAIPACAPHEEPDLSSVLNGTIWKIDGGTPLFARWTTDFDCGYETGWWYVIKDAPFESDKLSANSRKKIRQSMKKCTVRRIDAIENIDALYECFKQAFRRYENATNYSSYESFKQGCIRDAKAGLEYWACYDDESSLLIGYMIITIYKDCVELNTTKLHPDFLKKGTSAALYSTVLDHYLNLKKKKYLVSGTRNINHKTNTEEYKIGTFGYRRAYCKLNVVYNPKFKWVIDFLYLFRRILRMFDNVSKIHQVNAVLLMEGIKRNSGKIGAKYE